MRTKTIIICINFLFISNLLFSQSLPVDSIHISKADYLANFIQINNTVSEKYTHLENKKINIDSLSKEYFVKIDGNRNKEEYIKTLLQYFSELKNSHTSLFIKPYVLDCYAKLVNERLFIHRVDEEAFIKAGVKKYDEIIKIDNIPAFDWIESQKQYISSSTESDNLNRASWKVFRSYFKNPRSYEIKTSRGIKTVNVTFEHFWKKKESNNPLVNSKVISDSIGYIEINSMTGSVVNEFKESYKNLNKLPYLIVDIRNNGGGNSGYSERIIKYLIKEPIRASVSRKKLKPNTENFKGKLFVLISTNTFSAAESFALDLFESGDATFIGTPTVGDTGNRPKKYTTDYGMSFRIPRRRSPQVSFKGFPMEGIGIPPHFVMELTIDDYFKEKDTVLEYAIKFIEKNPIK
jgi:carboxyl-terminal processing protease